MRRRVIQKSGRPGPAPPGPEGPADPRRPPRVAPDWLGRALGRVGVPDAERLIETGHVALAGRVVTQPFAPVRGDEDVIIDGRRVSLRAPTRALAFHKPAGVVTSRVRRGVHDLLAVAVPPALRGYAWHAVGRLDKDTTGLLLFTNDERLVEHVTSPASHLPKRYVAQVQGQLDEQRLEPLRRGMVLDDGPARPARVRVRGPAEVEVELTEGRNHQVKRMLGAVGLPVRRLHREAIGGVILDVGSGACRALEEEEIREGLDYAPAPSKAWR